MKSILASIKSQMDRFIEDPQLSQIELMRKQVAFNWTIGSVLSIVILTPGIFIRRKHYWTLWNCSASHVCDRNTPV